MAIYCKKRLAIFLSPSGKSLAKHSLAGNNLIIPGKGEFGYSGIPAGMGKSLTFFLQCNGYGGERRVGKVKPLQRQQKKPSSTVYFFLIRVVNVITTPRNYA
jgi:hypothetical protein